METCDLFLMSSQVSRNIRIIPGRFDIGKWIRPVEFAFEVLDKTEPLEYKVDTPLFMVRFFTANDAPVKLTRVIHTAEIELAIQACTTVKQYRPFLPLKQLYKLGESYIKAWLNNQNKGR
jgi:DNA-binding LytR/AlgR family response regulator